MSDSSLKVLLDSRPSAEELEAGVPPEATMRQRILARAVRQWTDLMIDRTGRNSLLKYRALTKGTLELTPAQSPAFDALLAGRATPIDSLALDTEGDVQARGRAIYRKAQENFEERGIDTLYVAYGIASWTFDTPWPPAAPLVMLPAKLTARASALEGFDLTLTGGVEINPTFLYVMRQEFGLKIDPEVLYSQLDGDLDSETELTRAIDWLRLECAGVPGFTIDPRRVLANFAFAKLPMVRDLETMVDALAEHDIIAALAGVPEAEAALADARAASGDAPLPDFDQVPPADEFLILDSDSTQSAAIDRVLVGGNLVVKGPPGTGKSQTISNLIASCAARGKTVLFVAEKRAAIDAVTKRLNQRELGALVLDVHSGIGTRRQFAARMQEAFTWVEQSTIVDAADLHEALVSDRAQLRDASNALHLAREPWGVSLYDAFCAALEAGEETPLRLTGAHLDAAIADVAKSARASVRELAELGGIGDAMSRSVWRTATIDTELEAQRAQALLVTLRQDALRTARTRIAEAGAVTGLAPATTINQLVSDADLVAGVTELLTRYEPSVWGAELDMLAQDLAAANSGRIAHWVRRLFSGSYRRAFRDLRSHLSADAKTAVPPYEDALSLRGARETWRPSIAGGAPSAHPDAAGFATDARTAFEGVTEFATLGGAATLTVLPLDELDAQLTAFAADLTTLAKLPRIHALKTELEAAGFGAAVDYLSTDGAAHATPDGAERIVEGMWARSIIDAIVLGDPRLARLTPERLDTARTRFAAEDRRHIESTAKRVRRAAALNAMERRNEHREANALLEKQASLKSRHKPVRELIDLTMPVLLGMKPCWVMSPLMVSQLLPQRPVFDVVIFDEASQIMPHDAVAAIARGRQLVVAGDDRQLPPTAFFGTVSAEDEAEVEAEQLDGLPPDEGGTRGYESILDTLQPLLPWRQLGWHYRSKDERLIAFSNAHIYGGSLTTFPGAFTDPPVSHVLVASDPARPTAKGSSPLEVERVVELVLEHARTRPTESLGVIAMGIEHALRIDALLLAKRREHPECEAFFDESREERFFVKNLERVQGDERDAIILSIGYGKDAKGNLPYRFGPLLSEGGERRLNVAVTRAKRRMTLVSSFAHEDMAAGRSTARGVELLREYLAFAASGGSNVGSTTTVDHPLNAFELDVQRVLSERGLVVDAQHGSSDYRIDFVVRHPDQPGRYVLAVECDGAAYHSSPAARDRDRLRQEHLERLGWSFHRIWSTGWFHDSGRAADAVVAAFERELAELAAPAQEIAVSVVPDPVVSAIPEVTISDGDRGRRPAIKPGAPITTYSHAQLVAIARWIQSDGMLRTDDALMAEMRREMGFTRRGSRIDAALTAAVGALQS